MHTYTYPETLMKSVTHYNPFKYCPKDTSKLPNSQTALIVYQRYFQVILYNLKKKRHQSQYWWTKLIQLKANQLNRPAVQSDSKTAHDQPKHSSQNKPTKLWKEICVAFQSHS